MRKKYIDVLKAVAIFAVVFYHSGFLSFGYLGVDLFLVINGYLVTKSLENKLWANKKLKCTREVQEENDCFKMGWRNYFDFEISRIIRLLPVLLVAGLICMIVGYWVMLPDDYENLSESVIATNFFSNNILAAITTKDYWAVSNDYKPLMHTWYVGIVMQFYIVYPILFFLACFDGKNPRRTLLVMISTLAVISLLVYFGTTDVAKRFYYLPSRFFEFAVGGIVALTWKPQEGDKIFQNWFVYVCYAFLLALMVVNKEFIPANLKLVAVVVLSVVLVMSSDILENKVTANGVFAKIGAASYSIFVWHQVLLAFYRYTVSSHFTVFSYLLFLVTVAILSWLTYQFIEQKSIEWLKVKRSKSLFYVVIIACFVTLNTFAIIIYYNAGVVRDIPELYVSKQNRHRGMHAEYCDRGYKFDKPFVTDKLHWYVIGNSYGRDFVNCILESSIADSVEVSYSTDHDYKNQDQRFKQADKVFISTLGLTEKLVTNIEIMCMANGLSIDNVIVVGEKDFGGSNGQIYMKRWRDDYFEQTTTVKDENQFIKQNHQFALKYGNRYLDLQSMVTDAEGRVRVFSPDHHFISADCKHFSKGGAVFYAQMIEWNKYMQ